MAATPIRGLVALCGATGRRVCGLALVQRNGAILWCEQGEWSPTKADALDDLLLALLLLTDAFA